MTLGSSAPLGFPDWAASIPLRLIAEGNAYDGLRPGPGSVLGTMTFASNVITRSAGSFLDEGFATGQLAIVSGSAFNDGPWLLIAAVTALTLTFTSNVSFVAEGPTPGVTITSQHKDGIPSVWFGEEERDRWTGGNSVVFLPSSGAEEKPAAFHSSNAQRRHMGTVRWNLDVLIWGLQPSLTEYPGLIWNAERLRSAYEIWENVVRVLKGSALGFGRIEELAGWDQSTPVLRYGETLAMRFSVPIPFYDLPRVQIPTPLRIRPKTGEPQVKGPEQL